jgi:hypothetical protein
MLPAAADTAAAAATAVAAATGACAPALQYPGVQSPLQHTSGVNLRTNDCTEYCCLDCDAEHLKPHLGKQAELYSIRYLSMLAC